MTYWTDDRALDMEQRRLDADQQRAQEAARKKAAERGEEPPAWAQKKESAR